MTGETVQRILVLLPNNLGDSIMATPVLEGLRARYPEAHISFFVEQDFEGGVAGNPNINNLFTFPRKTLRDTIRNGAWLEGSRDFINVIQELGTAEYSCIINLSQHAYVSNLVSLLPAKEIKGCHFLREGNDALSGEWSEYLYAIPFARRYNTLHAVDIYRRIAGVKEHHGSYTIALTEQEKEDAGNYLHSLGIDITGGKIIVFQPGAAFSAKRWPVDHYMTLGRLLINEGWQVILSGAPAEKELSEGIQQQIGGNSFSTAGGTTFRQAIANLDFAQGCVTGDTALMHAAAGLNVKTYALFGTTNPVETGPYGSGHFVFSGGCNQKPCFYDTCKSMLCMKSILPETVFSCITNDSPPAGPGCDIYRTSVQKDRDYRILTTTRSACSYSNSAGAFIVQKAFEPDLPVRGYSQEEYDICREESQKCIALVTRMEALLQAYLESKDAACIRNFETCKNELAQLTGIGCFWTAIMNIRLNCVPMLDPVTGVRLSAGICAKTRKLIEAVFSH
jgi:ADP-heptose:LPS heptosyltransferase